MHIAFLTPEYPHPKVKHAAGIGTSIHNLAIALRASGVKVTVVVYGQATTMHFEEEGIKIHLLQNRKYRILGWYLHRKFIQNYLNKLVLAQGIDLIEAADWTGITALMSLRVPLVIRLHGSDAYFCHLEARKQKWKNFVLEKMALKKAKAYVAPTQFAATITKQIFKFVQRKIEVIPNGLNLKYFQNQEPDCYEKGVILYVGTLIRKKGVLELPDIFHEVRKQYPNAQLRLVGSDSFDIQTQSASTWAVLQQYVNEKDKANIHYLGKMPYQEIQKQIKRAHICIFPTFAETQGMVTIEAMAMQKPVVNSNIGWAKELIVDGESGFLVHPQEHTNFANKIVQLLKHPDLGQQMGMQARKRVEEKFDIVKIAQRNRDFYANVLKKSKE